MVNNSGQRYVANGQLRRFDRAALLFENGLIYEVFRVRVIYFASSQVAWGRKQDSIRMTGQMMIGMRALSAPRTIILSARAARCLGGCDCF